MSVRFIICWEMIFWNERSNDAFPTLAASFNQPRFCPNASWNPNATTFADSTIVGSNAHAIFVNTKNTVFVANRDNGRILIWLSGSAAPTLNISTSSTNPSSLFVTTDDQIFLDNQLPIAQVDRWTLNQTQLSCPMVPCKYCSGLFVDINNNLYCSQELRDQVIRKSLNSAASLSIITAGIGRTGSDANMLHVPKGLFVTDDLTLYVADFGNNRIQLFRSGELSATTVAGSGSNGTISLSQPTGSRP